MSKTTTSTPDLTYLSESEAVRLLNIPHSRFRALAAEGKLTPVAVGKMPNGRDRKAYATLDVVSAFPAEAKEAKKLEGRVTVKGLLVERSAIFNAATQAQLEQQESQDIDRKLAQRAAERDASQPAATPRKKVADMTPAEKRAYYTEMGRKGAAVRKKNLEAKRAAATPAVQPAAETFIDKAMSGFPKMATDTSDKKAERVRGANAQPAAQSPGEAFWTETNVDKAQAGLMPGSAPLAEPEKSGYVNLSDLNIPGLQHNAQPKEEKDIAMQPQAPHPAAGINRVPPLSDILDGPYAPAVKPATKAAIVIGVLGIAALAGFAAYRYLTDKSTGVEAE